MPTHSPCLGYAMGSPRSATPPVTRIQHQEEGHGMADLVRDILLSHMLVSHAPALTIVLAGTDERREH